MEYRLIQHNGSGAVYGVREDGMATGPLQDNDYKDNDAPNATIQVNWAAALDYADRREDLWESDEYTVLATDRDPLSAVVDQPQSLERGARSVERGRGRP